MTVRAGGAPGKVTARPDPHNNPPQSPEGNRMTITSNIETITPAQAGGWLLNNNPSNRPIRPPKVALLARDIREGNWHMTGEAIKFATTGALLDGQHRLAAVVSADRAVEMLVIRGLEPAAQTVMDTGTKRTAGDALHLSGWNDSPMIAAVARWGFLFDEGLIYTGQRSVSTSDIIAYADKWHDEIVKAGQVGRRYTTKIDLMPSVIALGYLLTARVDADMADTFFESLATGANLGHGSPILALTSRLREIKRNKTRVETPEQLSLLIRTWNTWRSGKTVATILMTSREGNIRCPDPK